MLLDEVMEQLSNTKNQRKSVKLRNEVYKIFNGAPIRPYELTRMKDGERLPSGLSRYCEDKRNIKLGDFITQLKETLPHEQTEKRKICQKINNVLDKYDIDADKACVTDATEDDFYRSFAETILFCILNYNKYSNVNLTLNNKSISNYMKKIFSDSGINNVTIVTQVGMVLLNNAEVNKAMTEYLDSGKSLLVIINTSDIRKQIGNLMINNIVDYSYNTPTNNVCSEWNQLKRKHSKWKLRVVTTNVPILHQLIKTSVCDFEDNGSIRQE